MGAELMALAKVSPCMSGCASVRASIDIYLVSWRDAVPPNVCSSFSGHAAARAARQHLPICHQDWVHWPAAAPPRLQSLSANTVRW